MLSTQNLSPALLREFLICDLVFPVLIRYYLGMLIVIVLLVVKSTDELPKRKIRFIIARISLVLIIEFLRS